MKPVLVSSLCACACILVNSIYYLIWHCLAAGPHFPMGLREDGDPLSSFPAAHHPGLPALCVVQCCAEPLSEWRIICHLLR